MADNTIKIGGELESMATGKIVAAASAIKDKSRNKTQEVINGDVEVAIAEQSAQFEALSEETSEAVTSASQSARDAKQYLADLQEAITGLPDGQAVSAQVAINEADIAGLKSKTDSISKQSTQSEEQAIIYETDGGVQVGKIDANGADFANLKRGGQQVARMLDLPTVPTIDTTIGDSPSQTNVPSTKAVKTYVDNNIPDYPIDEETTSSEAEEQVWGNNAETQEYVKIGSYGMKSKAYLDMNGDSIIEDEIGNTPSTTHAPSAKAVKTYVDENGIGGFPISKGTSLASSEKMVVETDEGTAITEFEFAESLSENSNEIIIGNNALTEVYLKIGDYGIKVKAIFDINGNPISNPVDSVDGYPIQASPCSPLLMSQGKAAIFKSWSFIGASYESGAVQYQTSGGVASQYADYVH